MQKVYRRRKMFGFDGEYRRRPNQNLGGSSQTCDRETVIRKAQLERQRRNEVRKRNNGAIVLQSYTRSFICRQRQKNLERNIFDDYIRLHRDKTIEDENLAYLLKRVLFFYDHKCLKDSERLIEICQFIIRNPKRLLENCIKEYIWLHRVKKLLHICMMQLKMPQISHAIPMRMLETFTSTQLLERHIEDERLVQTYLCSIFSYLVECNYFLKLRELIDMKCPPLDGEILHPPNHYTEALYQLVLRPLLLKQTDDSYAKVYLSFVEYMLAPAYTEPIKYFLLPCLAKEQDLPFQHIISSLQPLIDKEFQGPIKNQLNNTTENMQISPVTEEKHETTIDSQTTQPDNEQNEKSNKILSIFLLNSLFNLDRKHIANLDTKLYLSQYITVVAKISKKFLKLPKSAIKREEHYARNENSFVSSSSDEDDNNDILIRTNNSKSKTIQNTTQQNIINIEEKLTTLECIELLNNAERVQAIVVHVQNYIEDTNILNALCEICHNLMIINKMAVFEYKLLYTLAFIPKVIRTIWSNLAVQTTQMGFNAPLLLISKGVVPINDISAKKTGIERTIPMLATFCMLFGRLLPTLHDAEFVEDETNLLLDKPITTTHTRLMPFSLMEIIQLSKTLKEISMGLVELAFPETRSNLNEHYRFVLGRSETDEQRLNQQKQIWSNLLKVVVFVLNQLHTRDLRLGFCPDAHWTVACLDLPLDRPADLPLTRGSRTRGIRPFQPIRDFTRKDLDDGPPMSTKQIRSITILREIPFVVPFEKRVGIFQGLVAADKMRVQGHLQNFLQGPSIMLTVRRTHLYEDAFDKLRPENEPDLRSKVRVQFVSALGLDEAGIDGGGVFREFLSELIKTAFDPNRGFFMVTTDNKLYPNPNVGDLVPDFERHFYFIGRILGKAVYENLLVELPLAEFFLTKLAGKYSDVDIHQLASLDPELYKNLLYLKDYEGDVSTLNLDFTVASSSLGQTHIVELKPNGQSIPVTDSNSIEYLQLMADYKLNVQIRKHCVAFRRGLSNVLPVEWLYMFSNKELQILISGAEIPIDLEDLKTHCKYGGDYNPEHPTIIAFWSVVENFTDLQRRQLLKFVTSCSRPPLLGFKNLDPPFFIQNAGDMERLPTASTCTNLLKLPPIRSPEQMREKLLYAIQSGVGFELS